MDISLKNTSQLILQNYANSLLCNALLHINFHLILLVSTQNTKISWYENKEAKEKYHTIHTMSTRCTLENSMWELRIKSLLLLPSVLQHELCCFICRSNHWYDLQYLEFDPLLIPILRVRVVGSVYISLFALPHMY